MLYAYLVAKLHQFSLFYSLLNTKSVTVIKSNTNKTDLLSQQCGLTENIYGDNLSKALSLDSKLNYVSKTVRKELAALKKKILSINQA